ncbi:MAG: VOC family protein [Chloroflexaceae bacterium]|jgi:catechol 2,3-dioxygenase-like lactoylglutathione lyase family enzyme|nr:VOC family protein [Chloroflexaceae bacterium]
MAIRLGNINLFVQDIERARRFYVEALGLVEDSARSQPPGFYLLLAGGCTLTLQDASAPGAFAGSAESIEIGFAVDDVAAARQQVAAWGASVSDVQQMGWGGGFDARDPDGHRLTVYRMHGQDW